MMVRVGLMSLHGHIMHVQQELWSVVEANHAGAGAMELGNEA